MSLIPPIGPQDLPAGSPGIDAAEVTIDNPLDLLDALVDARTINATERDAGEIIRRMGGIVLSDAPASAQASYNWRYANGIWSTLFEPKRVTAEKYEMALGSLTDPERRAVVASLVAREPELVPSNPQALASGLASLAKYWWGGAVTRTTNRNGVTLQAVRTIDYDTPAANDNSPTPERQQHGRDGFERLLVRGQIDEDAEVATTLYAAGLKYETEHGLAYDSGFRSPDYSKPIVDGGGDTATPITERAELARRRIDAARNAMGARCAEVVDAVVLHGMTLAVAGRRYCGYRDTAMATAGAKERLNMGLRALAVIYGIAVRRAA